MDVNANISALVQYGLDKKLIEPCDKAFIMNYAGLFIHFLRLFCYDVVTKGKRKPLDYFTTNQCSSLFSPPLFFQRCPGL